EDLGMRHRLWVYSGRRGVHCWVCDDAVRKWSPALRAAAVEYLTLVKKYFEAYALVGQDILGSPESWDKVLALVPEDILSGVAGSGGRVCTGAAGSTVSTMSLDHRAQHRELLQGEFPKKRDSVQRWELLKGRMERTRVMGAGRSSPCYADWEIMLQFCFPRLDINVSKGVGHLLKSPFSVHPKTGRISVPLDLQKLDQFDPFAVPTISSLCHELDTAGDDGEQEDGEETETETEPKRRARDYKRTSLAPYVRVFERFVEEMECARRGELRRRSGESWGA
ncbi:PRI1 primase, partial [Brachypteracias leptosomus]|nr:PRI1 primase [Brachypteracias leptosomus]NXS64186.1 PRI1 primase [Brachypteracias leptosomus]